MPFYIVQACVLNIALTSEDKPLYRNATSIHRLSSSSVNCQHIEINPHGRGMSVLQLQLEASVSNNNVQFHFGCFSWIYPFLSDSVHILFIVLNFINLTESCFNIPLKPTQGYPGWTNEVAFYLSLWSERKNEFPWARIA